MKDYKKILESIVNIIETSENSDVVVNICDYIRENCPEFQESRDEKIRKVLVDFFKSYKEQGTCGAETFNGISTDIILAWLEKQSEVKPYTGQSFKYNEHIWSMCPRDNGVEIIFDGELKAFLSLEKSFIYPTIPQRSLMPKSAQEAIEEERVDNQNCVKPADKVEPKFKVGDWYQCTKDFFGKGVTFDKDTAYYCAKEGCLQCEYGCHIAIVEDLYDNFKLWTIRDAKDGDVLASKDGKDILIFKNLDTDTSFSSYYNIAGRIEIGWSNGSFIPATKEQRDTLFERMKETGYEWDIEKKELKKIEQLKTQFKSLEDGARTQSNQEWSEDDERNLQGIIDEIETNKHNAPDYDFATYDRFLSWLKSLKPRNTWNPSDEQMEALEHFVRSIGESGYASPHENNTKLLYSLLEQLKKLREK